MNHIIIREYSTTESIKSLLSIQIKLTEKISMARITLSSLKKLIDNQFKIIEQQESKIKDLEHAINQLKVSITIQDSVQLTKKRFAISNKTKLKRNVKKDVLKINHDYFTRSKSKIINGDSCIAPVNSYESFIKPLKKTSCK